jgi:hypothetical protein
LVNLPVTTLSFSGLLDWFSPGHRATSGSLPAPLRPISVGIAEVEQAALQHLVGGGTDARHGVCRIEGRLFYFGEEIVGIAIQGNSASLPQFRREKRPHNRSALRAETAAFVLKSASFEQLQIVTGCR